MAQRRKVIFFNKFRKLFILLLGCSLIGLAGCGHSTPQSDSLDPFADSAGKQDVVVYLHGNTLSGIADELAAKQVVASAEVFLTELQDRPIQPGYYLLKTEMASKKAVEMILDPSMQYRVGRLVIPEGTTLSSKVKSNGKLIPGIFNLLADASLVELNGKKFQYSEEDFVKAATELQATELKVPDWMTTAFNQLGNSFRKIEGLIRPGAWDDVNPLASPKDILKLMIEESATYYDQVEGFIKHSKINLSPYEKLILASIVEHEVVAPQYYPMVSRVILNRIMGGHRLEMDSTINYYAEKSNLNLYETDLGEENEWNTYKKYGLPVTPIGAVSAEVLAKSMYPAKGKWLFFVTVDQNGKTLFAETLAGHKHNIKIACHNKFLTVGC